MLSFFLPVCCCVPKAANAIPEFRQRILEGKTIIPVSMLRHHTDVYKRQGMYPLTYQICIFMLLSVLRYPILKDKLFKSFIFSFLCPQTSAFPAQ